MPTISGLQLPPSRNWQDFEILCCELWRRMRNDPNMQRNGRQGQPQCGVDSSGRPEQGSAWAGVQCKGKDNCTPQKLTETEMRNEIEKVKDFIFCMFYTPCYGVGRGLGELSALERGKMQVSKERGAHG